MWGEICIIYPKILLPFWYLMELIYLAPQAPRPRVIVPSFLNPLIIKSYGVYITSVSQIIDSCIDYTGMP